MAHLALAANVLNAIGGSPAIDDPELLPGYPGPLPGGVDDSLQVHLRPFSKEVVCDTFMVIEHPEHSIEDGDTGDTPPQKTIGAFYSQISETIGDLGEAIFKGSNPAKQVAQGFAAVEVIPVTDVASAQQAIEIIIEQGEGTEHVARRPRRSPGRPRALLPVPGDRRGPAVRPQPERRSGHAAQGSLVVHGTADPLPQGWRPGPGRRPDGQPSRRPPTYAEGTVARQLCDTFNYTYTSLLKALHDAFNGHPETLPTTIGLMWSLDQQFLEMAQLPADPSKPDGPRAAPSFEYQAINPG